MTHNWVFVVALSCGWMAVATADQSCSETTIPDLDGAWLCNSDWLIRMDNETGPIDGMTRWDVYLFIPTFYAVSKIRAVHTCDIDGAVIFSLKASVWDEGMAEEDDGRGNAFDEFSSFNWIEFNIPRVDFLEDGSQVYSGFGRRSPYWKLQMTMPEFVNRSCIPKLMFFARADIAAAQHLFTMNPVPTANVNISEYEDPPLTDTCDTVTRVPTSVVRKYRLDMSFYYKYTSAYGVPILSSRVVDDRALQRACYVVKFMLADRRDIRTHMYNNKGRVAIIGRRETVPMVPEMRIFPTFNRRAAGGTFQIPVNVGAEENMLCERGDGYARNQDIFMHEFAHGIHLIACYTALPNFNRNLQRAFLSARRRGLWRNTYANTNNQEYFAEGVQAYFHQQREGPVGGDGIQNHINTREELRAYDPTLYNIIKNLFPCLNDYIPRCTDVRQTRGLAQILTMNCDGSTKTTTTPKPTSTTTKSTEGTPSTVTINPTSSTTPDTSGTRPVTSTTIATTTTTTKTATTKGPSSCTDRHRWCSDWAKRHECTRNPGYMLNMCKRSCNQCQPSKCQNYDEHCRYWAAHCLVNPYVKQNCKMTCRSC